MAVATRLANLFLASLGDDLPEGLVESGRLTAHSSGDQIYRSGGPIADICFPTTALISLTVGTSDGEDVEIAIVGREGLVGVDRLLGHSTADANAVVQVSGEVLHIDVAPVLDLIRTTPRARAAFDAFLRSLLVEMSQSAVCNQVHSVEQRLARWLLHASDRAGRTDLRLTHQFVAQMLGVRRSSVTTVVGIFARAKLLDSQRGLISIVDRDGLRTLVCECYGIVFKATPKYR